jgi:hypothetical protein
MARRTEGREHRQPAGARGNGGNAAAPETHIETLDQEAGKTLDEARMVLPGMQALFGFQLIAVFNSQFQSLGVLAKYAHLVAVVLVTLGIALIMSPAILHRVAERGRVSRRFIDLASSFIAWAMLPLALGLTLDVMVVGWVISESHAIAGAVGAGALALFTTLWLVFPLTQRRRRRAEGR